MPTRPLNRWMTPNGFRGPNPGQRPAYPASYNRGLNGVVADTAILRAWWDLTDNLNMTANWDGTGGAPSDGDPVGRVNNKAGLNSDYYLHQSAAARKPTWRQESSDFGGRPALEYDGTDDSLFTLGGTNFTAMWQMAATILVSCSFHNVGGAPVNEQNIVYEWGYSSGTQGGLVGFTSNAGTHLRPHARHESSGFKDPYGYQYNDYNQPYVMGQRYIGEGINKTQTAFNGREDQEMVSGLEYGYDKFYLGQFVTGWMYKGHIQHCLVYDGLLDWRDIYRIVRWLMREARADKRYESVRYLP